MVLMSGQDDSGFVIGTVKADSVPWARTKPREEDVIAWPKLPLFSFARCQRKSELLDRVEIQSANEV